MLHPGCSAQTVGLALACLAVLPGALRAADDPDKTYARLLAAAKADPEHADYRALRFAYAASSHYKPYSLDLDDEKAGIEEAYRKGDYKTAVARASDLLDRNYVSIQAHMLSALLNEKASRSKKARFHQTFAAGLVASILKGQKGDSFESAYKVIDVREEYVVLDILKLHDGVQELQTHDGHEYDVLMFGDEARGTARKVYFNIDVPRRAMKKQFGLEKGRP